MWSLLQLATRSQKGQNQHDTAVTHLSVSYSASGWRCQFAQSNQRWRATSWEVRQVPVWTTCLITKWLRSDWQNIQPIKKTNSKYARFCLSVNKTHYYQLFMLILTHENIVEIIYLHIFWKKWKLKIGYLLSIVRCYHFDNKTFNCPVLLYCYNSVGGYCYSPTLGTQVTIKRYQEISEIRELILIKVIKVKSLCLSFSWDFPFWEQFGNL